MPRSRPRWPPTPDALALDEDFWRNARVVTPLRRAKRPVSLRLDGGILDWFQAQGPRCQIRIVEAGGAALEQRLRERTR
jgi:uncharacterized protein (DUF4415 family)